MVMALQGIADQRPHGERQMPVRAAILERDRRAVFEPIEHDGLAQNDAAERAPSDLVVIGRDVPIVCEEHGLSSRSIAAELRDEIGGDRLDLVGRRHAQALVHVGDDRVPVALLPLTTVTRSRLWQTAQRVSTSSLPGPPGSAAAVAAGAPGPKLVMRYWMTASASRGVNCAPRSTML